MNCISITKIGYFVDSLSLLFKFKAMEKIYIYSQQKEEQTQIKKNFNIILKVIIPLIKLKLKYHFNNLVNYYKQKKINNNINIKNNNNKREKNKINFNIDSLVFDLTNNYSLNKKKRNKTQRINSYNLYESLDSKSLSMHPNSVDNDFLHEKKNEKNNKKRKKKNKINRNDKKGSLSVSDDNEDIDVNKNNLNCPKMSKHMKINFLNPFELNDIKDNNNNSDNNNIDSNINSNINNSDKKDKIKIEKIKIIKKDNDIIDNKDNKDKNNNKENKDDVELDISAEKDNINNDNILWEYIITPQNPINNKEIKQKEEPKEDKKEEKKEDKKGIKKEIKNKKVKEEKVQKEGNNDEDIFDIEELLIDEEKPEQKEKNKNEQQIKPQTKEKEKEKHENKKQKNIEKFEINADIKKEEEKPKPKTLTLKEYFQNFPEKIINQITEDIIKELILTEIKSSENSLIPKKSFKYDNYDLNLSNNLFNSSNNSFNFRENFSKESSFITQQQNNSFQYKDNSYPNFFLNDSMLASVSASSVFNATIKDKKTRKSLLLYKKKVFPKLIKLIKEELYKKYDRLYENIKMPLKNNFEKIIIGLELQNSKLIKDNYKNISYKEDLKNIIDKNAILKKIEKYNKDIRNKDNLSDDNYYDKILNECVIDTVIEIIKNERLYKEEGEPFPDGKRSKEILFKFEKNKPKRFVDYVMKKLNQIYNINLGLINNNYEYYTQEQLNIEKERRLMLDLKNELKESEEMWKNLELEETQLKLEITEIINDQLYNEVMEILEHITLSRKKPELYQNKSIFACDEIPKLYFQQNAISENNKINQEEIDLINVEDI